jgi:hypothetical protein
LAQAVSGNEIIFLYSIKFDLVDQGWVFNKFLKFFISSLGLSLKCRFLFVSGGVLLIELEIIKLLDGFISFSPGICNLFIVLFLSFFLGLAVGLIINNALVQSGNTQAAFNLDWIADVRTELRILEVMKPGLLHDVIHVKISFLFCCVGCLLVSLFVALFCFLFKHIVGNTLSVQ